MVNELLSTAFSWASLSDFTQFLPTVSDTTDVNAAASIAMAFDTVTLPYRNRIEVSEWLDVLSPLEGMTISELGCSLPFPMPIGASLSSIFCDLVPIHQNPLIKSFTPLTFRNVNLDRI
jgi:hypothetical protein